MDYADASFLVAVYTSEPQSRLAMEWMQNATEALPFTPFHRHEFRTAIRQKVFRGEITTVQRATAFSELAADINGVILIHKEALWTDAFREADLIAKNRAESEAIRSLDLLHIGIALALNARRFLTLDDRQARLADAAGFEVISAQNQK
jgi:predicted nucleic acid-binding protein